MIIMMLYLVEQNSSWLSTLSGLSFTRNDLQNTIECILSEHSLRLHLIVVTCLKRLPRKLCLAGLVNFPVPQSYLPSSKNHESVRCHHKIKKIPARGRRCPGDVEQWSILGLLCKNLSSSPGWLPFRNLRSYIFRRHLEMVLPPRGHGEFGATTQDCDTILFYAGKDFTGCEGYNRKMP